MSLAARPAPAAPATVCRHPNEMDLARITRALAGRARYRYVSPRVLPVEDGYRIRSACCSRTIDPEGGEIDVALLLWREGDGFWLLHHKDHATDLWIEDSRFTRLADLVARLNADPARQFWQ